jgi:hypothetical protein
MAKADGSSWRRKKMKLGTEFNRGNKLCVDRRRDAMYVYGIYDEKENIPREFSGFALLAMSRRSKSNLPTIFSAVSRRRFNRQKKDKTGRAGATKREITT